MSERTRILRDGFKELAQSEADGQRAFFRAFMLMLVGYYAIAGIVIYGLVSIAIAK